MQPFLKEWKHFVHILDPPGRLGQLPPSLLIALASLLIGIMAAIVVRYIARK
jgi:hypothetical protein